MADIPVWDRARIMHFGSSGAVALALRAACSRINITDNTHSAWNIVVHNHPRFCSSRRRLKSKICMLYATTLDILEYPSTATLFPRRCHTTSLEAKTPQPHDASLRHEPKPRNLTMPRFAVKRNPATSSYLPRFALKPTPTPHAHPILCRSAQHYAGHCWVKETGEPYYDRLCCPGTGYGHL